jgi:O-antigen/teichoic acid export membrane protein
VVKIVLLVALAATIPAAGIDISRMLPVIVSLPLINLLIFAKLMPRHQLLTRDRQPPSVRQVGRFLAGDYTGGLCMLAISSLVPIVVAVRLGPGLSAYFYVAWMVGGVLDLLAVNMATSLTVEGAFDSQTLAANCRSALRRTLFILVPAAALVAALARPALDLYGPRYAAYGAPILELLALATLPKTLTELYLGALRAQSRTRLIAVIQVTRCVLILGLALGLTAILGVVGLHRPPHPARTSPRTGRNGLARRRHAPAGSPGHHQARRPGSHRMGAAPRHRNGPCRTADHRSGVPHRRAAMAR